MIKKKGCGPCKTFEPIIKGAALKNSLNFRTVQSEDMPENMRPDIFPYFYLMKDSELVENWAGTNIRKMKTVLKRHIKGIIFDQDI